MMVNLFRSNCPLPAYRRGWHRAQGDLYHGGSLNLLTTDKDRRANRYINERLNLKSNLRIRGSRIPGFLRPGQVLSPGPRKQRPDCCQGLGSAENFLKTFFAHTSVFHHDGQPVPVELSIASIPEDGRAQGDLYHGGSLQPPRQTKRQTANRYINERLNLKRQPARIRASRIPGFLRPGQVLSPGPRKQRPDCCQGGLGSA
ncbi:hypothetical protein TNCV_2017541 [Trichonephila clavipes]|nr:hypothetical protein TNCV_2017541 [Trichonephila clavipes]